MERCVSNLQLFYGGGGGGGVRTFSGIAQWYSQLLMVGCTVKAKL